MNATRETPPPGLNCLGLLAWEILQVGIRDASALADAADAMASTEAAGRPATAALIAMLRAVAGRIADPARQEPDPAAEASAIAPGWRECIPATRIRAILQAVAPRTTCECGEVVWKLRVSEKKALVFDRAGLDHDASCRALRQFELKG